MLPLALLSLLAGLAMLTAYPSVFGELSGLPHLAIGSALIGLAGILCVASVLRRLIAWQRGRRLRNKNGGEWGRGG